MPSERETAIVRHYRLSSYTHRKELWNVLRSETEEKSRNEILLENNEKVKKNQLENSAPKTFEKALLYLCSIQNCWRQFCLLKVTSTLRYRAAMC